jgi:multidrug efflux pump subunit AcrB
MSLVSSSLKKPVTTMVLIGAVFLSSFLAIKTIPIDIFPQLNLPTIYVIQPYGGMTPAQMEGFFATRLLNQFLFVNGIKNISNRNVQGLTVLKLSFFEKTDMAEASAQVGWNLDRALKFFPPGAVPPQILRFDASSLPVGSLVFSSETETMGQINDLVATRIRPMFASVPGLSAPPPIGSNERSIIINIDPDKLRSHNLDPEQVVEAMAKNNRIAPSGNIMIGNGVYLTTVNSLAKDLNDFRNIPLISDNINTVLLGDVATVQDDIDLTTGYSLINGKRSVYMAVVKTQDASTWEVVQSLKAKIPDMQALLPDDVHISYVFDQSVFVMNSVKSLVSEGVIGAILTGLMVLLFLRDWRSCIVVVVTIPVSILTAVLFLKLAGQTINIMTLSGLALAIGILVDQATVTIENIHQHLEMGKPKKEAIYDACAEVAFPLFLILLCIIAVFAPSFVMTGVPRALFLPLSLSIGFAMIVSYLLAQSMVPIISNGLLKAERYQYHHGQPHARAAQSMDHEEFLQVDGHLEKQEGEPAKNDLFEKIKMRFLHFLQRVIPHSRRNVVLYLLPVLLLAGFCFLKIGKDLLPRTNTGQYQLKLKLPDGTRLERTETMVNDVIKVLDSLSGNHITVTSAYAGTIPSNFATTNLYIENNGPQEATLQFEIESQYKPDKDVFQEAVRAAIRRDLPTVTMTFEPIELTEKIMSQGASTPIEVQVSGKDMEGITNYTKRVLAGMQGIPFLRDVQIKQPLHFPTISITIDRLKVAQMGLKIDDVINSVTAITATSRFTEKNLWLDEKGAYTWQAQVQMPQYALNSMEDLREIPLKPGQSGVVLQDVASFRVDTSVGEYDREGPKRFLTVGANLYKKDLQSGTDAVGQVIKKIGILPKGMNIDVKGMSDLLTDTLGSLQSGLLVAIIVIFLLLAANYQSFRLSLVVLSTVPAVLLGALLLLLATGSTLNLQSYMGIIMSVGVSVANAILIVTNAESLRMEYQNDAAKAASVAASIRLRPILMTSMAMVAGMIPMASGMGEAGDQTAPLGRAVIGGLIASTIAALFIVPQCYAWAQKRASLKDPSLLPESFKI